MNFSKSPADKEHRNLLGAARSMWLPTRCWPGEGWWDGGSGRRLRQEAQTPLPAPALLGGSHSSKRSPRVLAVPLA